MRDLTVRRAKGQIAASRYLVAQRKKRTKLRQRRLAKLHDLVGAAILVTLFLSIFLLPVG